MGTRPVHVLIVEDSATQAAQLQFILEENGYSVDTAKTGTEAMARARSKSFDIVLTDVVMPDMSGYEVCRQLRVDFGGGFPVILLTSLDDPSHIIRGLEAGANNFIVKPFQEDQLLARVEAALARGGPDSDRLQGDRRTVETVFRGEKFDIEATPEHMLDYLVATFEDILYSRDVLQKAVVAEKAARESQRFLQASLDALSGPIVILDENCVIISVNAAWRDQIRGIGTTELGDDDVGLGSSYLDEFKRVIGGGDDALAQAMSGITRVSTGEVPSFYLEYSSSGPGGERWGALRATRFREERPVRVVVAHEDITTRKLSEDALRRSETEYRALIERAVYGFFRSTPEGKFLMVNPAMVRILGYDSEEELLAVASIAGFDPEPSRKSGVPQRFLDAGVMDRLPVEWMRKDGDRISLLFSGRPVTDDSGAIAYIEVMVEDVTERLALEEQLRQAQRLEALGQLAGGVAHDFNNILSVIIIEAQLGLKRLPEDDPVRKRLDEIKQAGDRAAALTSQLLAFSRKQVVEPKVLNINRVITEMNTMLARLISADIELSSELDEMVGNILADQGQLEQIVANLVVNARDAMAKGGKITIRTSMKTPTAGFLRAHPRMQAGTLVVLEVQDSGSGIPPEVKAKMFDPFFTTKERGKGTGLGLATVYGIVQGMGGDIEVDSTLGAGTTMRIYLPLVDAVEGQDAADDEAFLARGLESVLVVEDDARLRRIAVQLLEEHGYTVTACEDGLAALSYLESTDDPIDLLLTDVVMPNLGGRELAERILESRPEIRVLFMSGYTDDEVLEEKIVTGRTPFLAKPFTAESLALAVRRALDGGEVIEA